ncbi:hypothetical protein LSAT2_008040 [Lamellibrachia satsuma]|nr:hypothetical protein LSAT2_008040 [Lamellibrachia satsuma]
MEGIQQKCYSETVMEGVRKRARVFMVDSIVSKTDRVLNNGDDVVVCFPESRTERVENIVVRGSKDCSLEKVTQCLKLMQNVSINTGAPIMPTHSVDYIKDGCRIYDEYSNCMITVKPHCEKTDRLIFMGIDNYYKYLCHTKFKEYIEYRDCLSNTNMHGEGAYCKDAYEKRLKAVRSDTQRPNSYVRDRICQYTEDFLDCVENVVSSFCSKGAASWQRGLHVKAFSPLVEEMGCPDWGSPSLRMSAHFTTIRHTRQVL